MTSYVDDPLCVTGKVTDLIGLKNSRRVIPTYLITFAGTPNGKYFGENYVFDHFTIS
jgi:hypothetical protein